MNLAAEYNAADVHKADVENRIEALLTAIFPSWQRWHFLKPDGIEVWQAIDSSRGAAVLHARGFATVILHGHRAARFLTCECATHEAPR